jgi:hypothetical protein
VRTIYERRRDRLDADPEADPALADNAGGRAFRALRKELIEVERDTLVALRNEGAVSAEVLQHLQDDLDLEAVQPVR